jgi:hypothetical protein
MKKNNKFETWWNAKGFDPNHPLRWPLRKFSDLGGDLDVIYTLCRMLAVVSTVLSQMVATNKQLAARNRRRTKEFRGLCSCHPGGKLRLTEVARLYTDSIIGSTVDVLKARRLVDLTVELSAVDVASIKQQALEPFANMKGFPEDCNAAIDATCPAAPNLLATVDLTKVTPEQGEWIKELVSHLWPSVFQNNRTKRWDHAGTLFLLFVTEHMRKTAKDNKPHFAEAFNLMKSLQGKRSQKLKYGRKSAEVRIAKLKELWPEWQAALIRFEQQIECTKVN